MGEPTIRILDVVHCKADKEARRLILPCLQYEDVVRQRSRFGVKSKVVQRHLITGRDGTSGTFLTGLLPKIKKQFPEINIVGKQEKLRWQQKPKLKGIKFYSPQKKAFIKIKHNNRGRIIFPTGSGKTIISMGIISMFPRATILYLCHTKDLIDQTSRELKTFKFKHYVFGGGYEWSHGPTMKFLRKMSDKYKQIILLSTIQSFSKLDPTDYVDFFDLTIVDEGHHVNNLNGQYGKVMLNNLSPRRYALTATTPTKPKEQLINEGLFGPTFYELTYNKGMKLNIIAKPIIKLLPVPYETTISTQCGNHYNKYYDNGIVKNKTRNSLISKEAIRISELGQSVLIIIEKTEHGKLLQKIFKSHKCKVAFVYGDTEKEQRLKVKQELESKKRLIVICSKVWKEGINIKSLNTVIYAAGMKEKKAVVQAVGRAQRTDKNKKHFIVVDFLDPYKYLAEHAIQRIQVYVEKGWL